MRVPESSVLHSRARVAFDQVVVWHLSHLALQSLEFLAKLKCPSLRALYVDSNRLRQLRLDHPSNNHLLPLLTNLWSLDLSCNALVKVDALVTLRAIGWLDLSHNNLRLDQLLCLREVHVLQLKVDGNPLDENQSQSQSQSQHQRRMKLAALLPHTWMFDGHFVTQHERQQAELAMDPFVQGLLHQQREQQAKAAAAAATAASIAAAAAGGDGDRGEGGGSGGDGNGNGNGGSHPSHFGSLVDHWDVDQHLNANQQRFFDVLFAQPIKTGPFSTDFYRLLQVIHFYNDEVQLHNAHTHFAPSKHWPNGQNKPAVPLDALNTLRPHEKMQLAVCLSSHLELLLPKQLVHELLHVILIENRHFTAQIIDDLLALPPFAVVFVLQQLCQWAHARVNASDHTPLEQQMWNSLPPIYTTFLATTSPPHHAPAAVPAVVTITTGVAEEHESMVSDHQQRYRYTLLLLSHTSLFSELLPSFGKSGKADDGAAASKHQQVARPPSFKLGHELVPLLRAAQVASLDQLDQVLAENQMFESERFWIGGFRIQQQQAATALEEHQIDGVTGVLVHRQDPKRLYDKPWALPSSEAASASRIEEEEEEEEEEALDPSQQFQQQQQQQQQHAMERLHQRKPPKVGNWIELGQRQYARITSVSDRASVVFIGPLQQPGKMCTLPSLDERSCRLLSFHVSQLVRISSTIWRLINVSEEELDAVSSKVAQLAAFHVNRMGRLHRESTHFHRHGAKRNQGFPNEPITCHELQLLHQPLHQINPANWLTRQPQPIEIFATNNTLDANYVVASSSLISLQNCVAAAHQQQHQQIESLYAGGSDGHARDTGWSPVKQTPFSLVDPGSNATTKQQEDTDKDKQKAHTRLNKSPTKTTTWTTQQLMNQQQQQQKKKKTKTTTNGQSCNEELDDWHEIQREMEQLLRKRQRPQQQQPESPDVRFFLTAVEDHELVNAQPDQQPSTSRLQPPIRHLAASATRVKAPVKQQPQQQQQQVFPCANVLLSKLASQDKMKRSASCSRVTEATWRAVGTKPEFFVAKPNVSPPKLRPKSPKESNSPPTGVALRPHWPPSSHAALDKSQRAHEQGRKPLEENSAVSNRFRCAGERFAARQSQQEAAGKHVSMLPMKVSTTIMLPALISKEDQNTVRA